MLGDDGEKFQVLPQAVVTADQATAGNAEYNRWLKARQPQRPQATKSKELNPSKQLTLSSNVSAFFFKENSARMQKGWPSESLLTDQLGWTDASPKRPKCECCGVVWLNPKLANIEKHFKSAFHLKSQHAILGDAAAADPISIPGTICLAE